MKNPFPCRAAILVLCLAFATHALAIQIIPLSLEKLTRQADLVLQGTVKSTTCQRDEHGRIYTRVVLDVADVWKGHTPPPGFVIVQAGGVLGEEIAAVSGQEDFEIGEEVALFLVLNPRGEGVVIGISQGKFKVFQEKGMTEKTVSNGIHGKARADGPGVQRSAARSLTVAELKQRVRAGTK